MFSKELAAALLFLSLAADAFSPAPHIGAICLRAAQKGMLQSCCRKGGTLLRAKNEADVNDDDPTKGQWDEYDGRRPGKGRNFNYNKAGGWEQDASAADDDDGGAFQLPNKQSGGGIFGAAAQRPSPFPAVSREGMTAELRERVLRVSIDAMDHYPPQEVERRLAMLWEAGPDCGPDGRTMRALVFLTGQVEDIENEAVRRVRSAGADLYDLEDAIRVARSRVRGYISDSDYYDPDHWLSLDRSKPAKDGKSPVPDWWPF